MTFRLISGATVAVLSVAAFLTAASGQDDRPKTPASDVIVVDRGRVILAEEAVLASDRPGILKFVEPEEGSKVEKGQKVAGLNDEVAAAAVRVAEETAKNDIEVRYAEKAAEVAEAEYQKAVLANRRVAGSLPEVEVERLRLSVERAKLQIEKAALDQQVARLQRDEKAAELATYQVVSPIDGVVVRVSKHAGEAVQQGDPILQIVRTDTVRVEGLVSVVDALRIQVGDPVAVRFDRTGRLDLTRLSPAVRDRVFVGKIGFVDVTANVTTHQVRVWAEVPNEKNLLRAGLPVEMEIATEDETISTETAEASE